MISKYPEIKIDYTGVDIDEESCQKAMEELSLLKTKLNDNFTLRILTMDMNSLTLKGEIPPCDLALAMHALYYAKDTRKDITDVHTLLKADGKSPCCIIILPLLALFMLQYQGLVS